MRFDKRPVTLNLRTESLFALADIARRRGYWRGREPNISRAARDIIEAGLETTKRTEAQNDSEQ